VIPALIGKKNVMAFDGMISLCREHRGGKEVGMFMVDKTSPLPIYYQLEEEIKSLIENGELLPGDMIPSERELSEKYEISRMTVRQAINNLVNDGFLIRKQGVGTFVSKQKLEQKLKGLTSFSEDMRSKGMAPSTEVLDFQIVESNKGISEQLALPEKSPVYEVKRIRLADGIPMALEISYLSAERIPGLTAEVVKGSLYEYVENHLNLKIGWANQVLEASIARQMESKILNIQEGAPVLLIKRHTFLKNGQPLEVVKSVYPGDRYKFVIDMQRN
jgi:GntR family transcriptional regulator